MYDLLCSMFLMCSFYTMLLLYNMINVTVDFTFEKNLIVNLSEKNYQINQLLD